MMLSGMQRAMKRFAGVLLMATACRSAPATGTSPVPKIQRDAARFSIESTTDTTVVFRQAEVQWLKPGMRGHAVDPLQRDALIARLTILRVDTSGVLASITGKVSEIARTQVVLVSRPPKAWWRDRRFWFGAGAGAAIGAITAASAR